MCVSIVGGSRLYHQAQSMRGRVWRWMARYFRRLTPTAHWLGRVAKALGVFWKLIQGQGESR